MSAVGVVRIVIAGEESKRMADKKNTPRTTARHRRAASSSRSATASPRGTAAATRRRKAPARSRANTLDTRIINGWQALEPHHKRGILSGTLLLVAALLLAGLFASGPSPFWRIGEGLRTFMGWGAYVAVLGLALFAVLRIVELSAARALIRLATVLELIALLLLLLGDSSLWTGGAGGLLGGAIAHAARGLPLFAAHLLLEGLALVLVLLIFHISFSHIQTALRPVGRMAGVQVRHGQRAARASFARRPYGRAMLRAGMQGPTARPYQNGVAARDDDDAAIAGVAAYDAGADDLDADEPSIYATNRGMRAVPADAVIPVDPMDEHDQAALRAAQRDAQQAPLPGLSLGEASTSPAPPGAPEVASAASPPAPPARNVIVYQLPPVTLLNSANEQRQTKQEDMIADLIQKVEHGLRSFRVEAEVPRSDVSVGPTVIRLGIRPVERPRRDDRGRIVLDDRGSPVMVRTRVSRIMALQNDLALLLEAKSIRMEAPVPGRPYVGMEIPNKHNRLVTLREVLESDPYRESLARSRLTIALGKDVAGAVRVGDLARFPHLLIAGATGAGKSVCLNSIIACVLMQATPEDVRFLMVDPKMVELTMYNGIPHLLAPVVTDVDKVVGVLKRAVAEMHRRYTLFAKLGVRNLDRYRRLAAQRADLEPIPNIVIIIDELADLMMAAPEEVESLICRLAQLARATGIHLVIATQRPSVDVITGLIKANIPTRISFMVSSSVDSRTILDMGGAERLLGRGDMLYLPADAGKPERIQGTFLADEEIERIVEFWQRNTPVEAPKPDLDWEQPPEDEAEADQDDELLEEAKQVVREYERASISLLQRRLRIGYSRAARLIDQLEASGFIGPAEAGGRAREVLGPTPVDIRSPNGATAHPSLPGADASSHPALGPSHNANVEELDLQ
jgi:hypothetical protein